MSHPHPANAAAAAAAEGIRSPRELTILRGVRIVRFGSSKWARASLLAGCWWIYEADYLAYAAAHSGKLDEGLTWRFALAVPQSKGNHMDVVVCAEVIQPVSAYIGLAKPQRRADIAQNGASVTWQGSQSLLQLYIPDMEVPAIHTPTPHCERSLRLAYTRSIESHQLPIRSGGQ